MALLQKSALGKAVVARRATVSVVARAGKAKAAPAAKAEVADYVANMAGVSAPFNNPFFDPLNLVATAKDIDEVRRWRESEVTHGRVAMLAALGFIVGEQLEDFPAFFNADGHIAGPAIYQFQQVEARGGIFWAPLVVAIGLAESYRVGLGWSTPAGAKFNTVRPDGEYDMGDLGFDPLGLKPEDPEALKVMQTKELNNGRLAMIAIAAFTAEELVSKQEIFEHLALRLEVEAIEELDDIERDIGIKNVTPIPALVLEELKK